MTNIYIFYHDNCLDGFTSAWVANRFFTEIGIKPVFHGETVRYEKTRELLTELQANPRPHVKVFFLDCCPPSDLLIELQPYAKTTVIDHHISNEHRLQHAHASLYEVNKSGAGLTWQWFYLDREPPPIVRYVQDRDIWKFEYPETKEVTSYLSSIMDDSFTTWSKANKTLESSLQEAVLQGQAIIRAEQAQIKQLLKNSHELTILGLKTMATNSGLLTSETGHELALLSESKIGVCYNYNGKSFKLSMRSTEDGPNVADICAKFGGGGHAHAAGCSVLSLGDLKEPR